MIKAKFGWDDDEATLYNTIISSSAIFGVVTGSLCGGKFITGGRRKALIIFNILGAFAVSLTMVLNYWMIVVGRYFFGFCCGVFSVAGPKMLDETVPIHLNSKFGTATNSLLSGGIMVAVLLGALLPDDLDYQGQKEDGNWRILYGFPYVCQILTVVLLLVYFKEDSIGFSISNGNTKDALSLIKKVYHKDEDPQAVLNDLMNKSQKGMSDITLGQATCDKRFRRGTWIAFALCFF